MWWSLKHHRMPIWWWRLLLRCDRRYLLFWLHMLWLLNDNCWWFKRSNNHFLFQWNSWCRSGILFRWWLDPYNFDWFDGRKFCSYHWDHLNTWNFHRCRRFQLRWYRYASEEWWQKQRHYFALQFLFVVILHFFWHYLETLARNLNIPLLRKQEIMQQMIRMLFKIYFHNHFTNNQILAQFKLLWIASPHLLYFASRISVGINGLNEVIDDLSSSDSKDHKPIVLAAANAAPNDVVSAISGRTTSIPDLKHLLFCLYLFCQFFVYKQRTYH